MENIFFDNKIISQIRKVIEYSEENIYQTDDLLDMMNNQLDVPGAKPEHNILVPSGRWICYYIVDHPNKGRCHYFQIKPDASGAYADKYYLDYIIKVFGIDKSLEDENIIVDNKNAETKIIIPYM